MGSGFRWLRLVLFHLPGPSIFSTRPPMPLPQNRGCEFIPFCLGCLRVQVCLTPSFTEAEHTCPPFGIGQCRGQPFRPTSGGYSARLSVRLGESGSVHRWPLFSIVSMTVQCPLLLQKDTQATTSAILRFQGVSHRERPSSTRSPAIFDFSLVLEFSSSFSVDPLKWDTPIGVNGLGRACCNSAWHIEVCPIPNLRANLKMLPLRILFGVPKLTPSQPQRL